MLTTLRRSSLIAGCLDWTDYTLPSMIFFFIASVMWAWSPLYCWNELTDESSTCSTMPIDVSASLAYLASASFNFVDWYGMKRRGEPMVYAQHYLRRKYTGFMYIMEL